MLSTLINNSMAQITEEESGELQNSLSKAPAPLKDKIDVAHPRKVNSSTQRTTRRLSNTNQPNPAQKNKISRASLGNQRYDSNLKLISKSTLPSGASINSKLGAIKFDSLMQKARQRRQQLLEKTVQSEKEKLIASTRDRPKNVSKLHILDLRRKSKTERPGRRLRGKLNDSDLIDELEGLSSDSKEEKPLRKYEPTEYMHRLWKMRMNTLRDNKKRSRSHAQAQSPKKGPKRALNSSLDYYFEKTLEKHFKGRFVREKKLHLIIPRTIRNGKYVGADWRKAKEMKDEEEKERRRRKNRYPRLRMLRRKKRLKDVDDPIDVKGFEGLKVYKRRDPLIGIIRERDQFDAELLEVMNGEYLEMLFSQGKRKSKKRKK